MRVEMLRGLRRGRTRRGEILSSPDWEGRLRELALDALFEESTDATYVLAPDGTFIAGNRALLQRTGRTWESLRAEGFGPTVHPEDIEFVTGNFAAAVGGETRRFEARGIRPDGTVYHAHVLLAALTEDGRTVGVLGVAHDVDELVGARNSLNQARAGLLTALNGVNEAMAFVDAQWRVVFLNRAALALVRLPESELIGASLWDVPIPDPEGADMLREAMRSRQTLTRRRFDEALQRWVEVTAFPAGDLLGIKVNDVTEMEIARRRILDDSHRLHAQTMLLDSASDAILMRGLDGVIEYANLASAELLGVEHGSLEGRQLGEALGIDPEALQEIERELGRSGHWEGDLAVRTSEGEERITDARWRVVDDPLGNPEAVFCMLTDVTERRRQAELLIRSQRMESIGTLASGIAHDLNNVLTPLLLSTQLLSADESDPTRARILEQMRLAVERGSDMIRQVLTFARGVEGERAVVDVGELLRRFTEFCRDILPKEIAFELTADDGLAVVGDETQLLQVLMNLSTNARDAMPHGGVIRVTARGDATRVVIEVSDDGSGMTPDVLARIFEPFYTTKGIGRGTGLGLSMSQAIARTHGGSLEATSRPGVGTTFRLELPRTEREPDAARATTAPPPDLTGVRVLIVDDEPDIADAAALVIERAGGAPMATNDARHAQRVLRGAAMDVVVTDLVMPGFTGRAFLDWLAEHHPSLPVVAMSGVPEQGLNAARRPNVHLTLDKPFTAERLLRAVRSAVREQA